MDQLLELATNSVFVGIAFVVALAILHYLLVFKYPLTAKQWKLAEYVWVALALVSVVSVFEEARLLRSEQAVDRHRQVAEQKIWAIRNWFEVYDIYACDENADNPETKQLCSWVNLKNSELGLILSNEEFPADVPANLLLGLGAIRQGIGEADKQIIGGHLKEYLDSRSRYIAAVKGSRHSALSALLISLAPLMFAIAVALKFAKVTGEYRLIRK